MELITNILKAIDYMEKHLTDKISTQDVAEQVYLSPFFLQKGGSLITGCGIGEYTRNRRLHNAALDLKETEDKVIGFQKEFDYETAYQEIPKFWGEICEKYAANVYTGNEPANPFEKAIIDHCIGEY